MCIHILNSRAFILTLHPGSSASPYAWGSICMCSSNAPTAPLVGHPFEFQNKSNYYFKCSYIYIICRATISPIKCIYITLCRSSIWLHQVHLLYWAESIHLTVSSATTFNLIPLHAECEISLYFVLELTYMLFCFVLNSYYMFVHYKFMSMHTWWFW